MKLFEVREILCFCCGARYIQPADCCGVRRETLDFSEDYDDPAETAEYTVREYLCGACNMVSWGDSSCVNQHPTPTEIVAVAPKEAA